MSVDCFIPIKTNSERVPNKNFRKLGGVPLYQIVITKALDAGCFDRIFVDTDSYEVGLFTRTFEHVDKEKLQLVCRPKELTEDTVNGNDLLTSLIDRGIEFNDYIVQLFATAPFLSVKTIKDCVAYLVSENFIGVDIDSVTTVTKERGFYWHEETPLYRTSVLPRSQDMIPIIKETTGLYGITREAFMKYRQRIGAKPLFYPVPKHEAVDLDTNLDFAYAEFMLDKGVASIYA